MAINYAKIDAAQDEIEDVAFALAERLGLTTNELCGAMIGAVATVVACNTTRRSAREEVTEEMAASLRGAIQRTYRHFDQAAERLEVMKPAGSA